MSGLSLALMERYAALRFEDLPPATVHAAKISLLDGLGVMLAASRLEPAAAPFAQLAVALGMDGGAMLVGRPERVTAPLAALANGALAHALDFEDTHDEAKLHPNAALIPAVLALAEERGKDGRQFLLALAAGCDFACRLGLALDGDPAGRGWYHPPMLSALGATLGAAILVGVRPPQAVAALSLAGCQFALNDELKRSPKTHLRAVRDGLAARAAVEAVLLAERGIAGTDAPLEGESGLFAMLTGRPAHEAALVDGLGLRFEGEAVGIKVWPCCRATHAGIADEHVLALARRIHLQGVRRGLEGVEISARLSGGSRLDVTSAPPEAPRAGLLPFSSLSEKLQDCLNRAGATTAAATLVEAAERIEEAGLEPLLAAVRPHRQSPPAIRC